jgi:hypothetical protein
MLWFRQMMLAIIFLSCCTADKQGKNNLEEENAANLCGWCLFFLNSANSLFINYQ